MRREIEASRWTFEEAEMGESIWCALAFVLRPTTYSLHLAAKPEYAQTLVELTGITEELIRNHMREAVWFAAAIAQRVNVDSKIDASVKLVACFIQIL